MIFYTLEYYTTWLHDVTRFYLPLISTEMKATMWIRMCA